MQKEHFHECMHVCLVTSGEFIEARDDMEAHYTSDSVLIRAENRPHSNYFRRKTTIFNLELEPDWAGRFGVRLAARSPRDFGRDPILREIVADMENEYAASSFFSDAVAISFALDALTRLRALGAAAPERRSRWQAEVMRELRLNYRSGLDLNDLAHRLNLDRAHVARAFRQKTGMTLTRFLHEIRTHAAAKMMQDQPDAALTEIAAHTGFADQAHFTRIFKRIAGITPAAFRKANGRRR